MTVIEINNVTLFKAFTDTGRVWYFAFKIQRNILSVELSTVRVNIPALYMRPIS